jgi:pSer/pThr/pTyr-binding forkhead associated (FHA) protein
VLGGKYDGRLIALKGKRFLVGRESDCHLRPNSDQISRHHCAFSIDEYSVRLKDLGSTNGTFVDSERLDGDRVLLDGDEVSFGDLKFRVMIQEISAEQAAALAAGQAAPVSGDSQLISTADLATIPAASDGDTREIKIDQQALATPPAEAKPEESKPEESKPAEPAPAAAESQPAAQSAAAPPQPEPTMQPVPAGPPQQYPGYQVPQYPGFPQQNWYYPQQPWGYQGMPQPGYPQPYPQQPYPQPYYPQQPYPQQQPYPGQYGNPPEPQQSAPAEQSVEQSAEQTSLEDIGVRLPDPESTGARDEPKPAAEAQPATAQPAGKTPSQLADEMIRRKHRRG